MAETGSTYITDLIKLRKNLAWLLNKELLSSLVELQEKLNKSFLAKHEEYLASRGTDCAYAAKAKELFLQLQEKDIAKQIEGIYKNYIETK